MTINEPIAIQMADTKKRDAEEMIELFLKMSELNRAKVFGYAQGVESMSTANPKKTA
jgi:hypothetical protein